MDGGGDGDGIFRGNGGGGYFTGGRSRPAGVWHRGGVWGSGECAGVRRDRGGGNEFVAIGGVDGWVGGAGLCGAGHEERRCPVVVGRGPRAL